MAALLSWHVQNCFPNWSLVFKKENKNNLIKSIFWAHKMSVWYVPRWRIALPNKESYDGLSQIFFQENIPFHITLLPHVVFYITAKISHYAMWQAHQVWLRCGCMQPWGQFPLQESLWNISCCNGLHGLNSTISQSPCTAPMAGNLSALRAGQRTTYCLWKMVGILMNHMIP